MNRYEFVLSAISEAQQTKLATAPAQKRQRQQKPKRRQIRSMIVDATRPLHDVWAKITKPAGGLA